MIPMHFGTFPLGKEPMSEPPARLLAAASKAGIADRVRVLSEGETLEVQHAQVDHRRVKVLDR